MVEAKTILAHDFKMSSHQLLAITIDYYNGILKQKLTLGKN